MVNDGSNESTTCLLRELADSFSYLTVLEHKENQGKGGAVQTGLKEAYARGHSHALQIDADGQHDLSDVDTFLTESKHNPEVLISGKPIYNESVPKHRYYARGITHFWVWIETLSFSIKDTMCGYRVYPLAPTISLLNRSSLGKRMDFDIEVMVRLYWDKLEFKFIPTKVDYPEHGTSHFKAFRDNVLISWMHTKLVFGMLLRLPKLIIRKLR